MAEFSNPVDELGMAAMVNKTLTVTSSDGQARTLEFTDTSLTVNQAGIYTFRSNIPALLIVKL